MAAQPVRLLQQARSKYRATRCVVDGHAFASKAESRRYGELKLLEKAGQITRLVCQPRFPLVVNGQVIGTLVADFSYVEPSGALVVEDVKGMATLPLARWKQKHFFAQTGVQIREIR